MNSQAVAAPQVNRYLRVIGSLTEARDPGTRAWAKQCLRDMASPGVSVTEYLEPLMTLPVCHLDHYERRARQMAQ